MDDQVGSDEDRAVALPRRWGRTRGGGLGPRHDLEIKNVHVVEEIFAIPTSEDEHLRAADQVGAVIEPGRGSTTTFRSLEPCHGDWIQGMEIAVGISFVTLAAEYDNSRSSEDC